MKRFRFMPVGFLLTLGLLAGATTGDSVADDAVFDDPPTRAQLLDPAWIEEALVEMGIDLLIKQYDDHDDPVVQRVRDALVLSRWFLRLHPEELRSQLQARLMSSTEPELQVFQELPADRVRARAMRASLNQAGDGLVNTCLCSRQAGDFIVSPDGLVVAIRASRRDRANQRNTTGIELRNGLTGDLIAYVAEGHEYRFPVALSVTRQTLIAVERRHTAGGTIGIALAWDLSSNQMLWQTQIFGDDYPHDVLATFSPDASKVAIVTRGKYAVYDVATGDVLATLDIAADSELTDVAFLSEDQLAGCVHGSNLRIWDTATGAVAFEQELWAVKLSDDGQMAFTIDEKPEGYHTVLHRIRIHETLTGDLIREIAVDERIKLQSPDFRTSSFDFDPEGAHVVVTAYQSNGPIVAFNIESGEVAARLPQGMSVALYMRPITGLRVLTSSFDDLIHVWDLNRSGERLVAEQPGRITAVDITADGRFGVTNAAAEGELHLWDLETGASIGTFTVPAPSPYIRDLCISDNAGIILALYDETVFRVDPVAGTVETLLESPLGKEKIPNQLGISGDGTAAIAVGGESALVFDPSTGASLLTTKGGRYADISQDGNLVLAGNHIINRNTSDEMIFESFNEFNVELCDDGSRAVDFSPFDGYVVWNIATNSPLAGAVEELKYEFVDTNNSGCDISADGRFVVLCDANGEFVLYDTQERKRLATLGVDDTGVHDCAISADGSSILLTTHMGRLHHYRLENLP